MPPVALAEAIKKIHGMSTDNLGIKEIVKLEQYFRVLLELKKVKEDDMGEYAHYWITERKVI